MKVFLNENNLINFDEKEYKNNTILILKLKSKSKNFKNMIKLASEYDFNHPYIDNGTLYLYKKYKLDSKKEYKFNTPNDLLRSINFSIRNYNNNKFCKSTLFIDEKSIEYLKKHTLYDFDIGNGKKDQKEISGIFKLLPLNDNQIKIYIEDNDTTLGESEKAEYKKTVGSFHTHPFNAYVRHNVCIAYPSADDFFTIMYIYATGHCVFHITSTVEGMYIITIKLSFMSTDQNEILKNFQKYKDDIEDKYGVDYPTCNPKKDNKKKWAEDIPTYLKKINKLPYFNVHFISWEDAHLPFEIIYKKTDDNCIICDRQLNFRKLIKDEISDISNL